MKPVIGLVLGSVLIPLGLVLSFTWLPSSIAEATSYADAGPCKEPIPNGNRCWTEVGAVVKGTEVVHHSKSSSYYVDLQDDFGTQRVEVAPNGTFDALRPAQTVSARFWRGNVALIHVQGADDLTSESEPGTQLGWAIMAVVATLLAGSVFFLGALGVHRVERSWTVSVTRAEYGEDMLDAVAPPARRWLQAILVIASLGFCGGVLAHAIFGAALIPAGLISAGMGALLSAWLLHHQVRTSPARRQPGRKHR
ncbi:MAG TPA: hypothetical protein VFR68_11835 [Candidatus Dormibacteraeota bacterium]|nr:hypothetical protein [Candidatus Dormibacteraeota bacterium]